MKENLCVLILIIIDIVILYVLKIVTKKNKMLRKEQLLMNQYIYKFQYSENMQRQYEDLRKLRHELKNHYLVIAALLEQGEYEKAKEYTESSLNQTIVKKIFVRTNNPIVNAVVNCKSGIAEDFGIEVSVDIVADFDGIKDVDLCSLISNMFDNAIETTKNLNADRKIIFSVKKEGIGYLFSMKNTIKGSVLKENPTLSTTRKDKQSHGWGIKVIKDIAKKYKGMVDFFEENNLFVCDILLTIE